MTTNWKQVLGLPTRKTRPTWVDYAGFLLGIVPLLVVFWVLEDYGVPEWPAVIIAFGWVFPGVYVGSRVTAWRERHANPGE